MFKYEKRGDVTFAFGDGMLGKVELVLPQIRRLADNLGLPEEVFGDMPISKLVSDWASEFRKYGATQKCFRDWIHDQPATKDLPVPNSGAQIVLVARGEDGDYWTMVQIRQNYEIGFPGGASSIWCYNGKEVWEDVLLTAHREFKEEVGQYCNANLVFLDFTTTTNHYEYYPDTYAPSMYYGSEVSYNELMRFAIGSSDEGSHAVIRIKDLNDYKWFNNAAPVFELLQKLYA